MEKLLFDISKDGWAAVAKGMGFRNVPASKAQQLNSGSKTSSCIPGPAVA
jgi:hypothetical protein